MIRKLTKYIVLVVVIGLLAACAPAGTSSPEPAAADSASAGAVTLTLGGYTTPREAYAELIPIFQAQWKEQTGQDVTFEESYLGSGAQSRARLSRALRLTLWRSRLRPMSPALSMPV